jgi:hypothetical protein
MRRTAALFAACAACVVAGQPPPHVLIPGFGVVEGLQTAPLVNAFLGIPYAAPPLKGATPATSPSLTIHATSPSHHEPR